MSEDRRDRVEDHIGWTVFTGTAAEVAAFARGYCFRNDGTDRHATLVSSSPVVYRLGYSELR